MGGVAVIPDPFWKRFAGMLVYFGWCFHLQSFVWSHLVIFSDEGVLPLLFPHIIVQRLGTSGLQIPMHSFMSLVLFWVSWIRKYRQYPKVNEPEESLVKR